MTGRKPHSRRVYAGVIEDFADNEDCSPDAVIANPRCAEIARRFDKTPEQVATDINRLYVESYQPLRSHLLQVLDGEDE